MNRTIRSVFIAVAISAVACATTRSEDKPMSPVDSILRTVGGVTPGPPRPMMPCIVKAKPNPYPSTGGQVNLGIEVTPMFNCEGGVKIMIDSIDNLVYTGWDETRIDNIVETANTVNVSLEIPSGDTSGIVIAFHGVERGWSIKHPYYFVAEQDTVKFYEGAYREAIRAPTFERPKRVLSARDSIAHLGAEFQPPPTVRIGQYDEQGRFVPMDSIVDGRALDGRRVGHFDEAGDFIAADSVLKENEIRRQVKVLADSIRTLPGGETAWGVRRSAEGYPVIYSREKAKDSSHAYFKSLRDSVMAAKDSTK